jgi:superfamily II DNA/RNA helicase
LYERMNFKELGLGAKTLQGIESVGYREATPIQEQTIPHVLNRRHLFGCAQTGTGKTASYTLPILDLLESGRQRARLPRVLILTPTRELAQQVEESFTKYGKFHNFKLCVLIGGEPMGPQEKNLSRGADVIIATPGRLIDFIDRQRLMTHAIDILVIDEADRMLDMGFMPDIEKIKSFIVPTCQTIMFSATLSDDIKKIAHTFLVNPVEIFVTPPAQVAENVEQFIIKVKAILKKSVIKDLIEEQKPNNAIIFCNRKKDIPEIQRFLRKHNYSASALHGDLDQGERKQTLQDFKDGKIAFLVASDVAARGIDVEGLSCVFNYDIPNNPEEYVHRIGRTGRAGHQGKAFTLMSETESKLLRAIQKLIGITIPEHKIAGQRNEEQEEPLEVKKAQAESKAPRSAAPRQDAPKAPRATPAQAQASGEVKDRNVRRTRPDHSSHERKVIVGFGDMIPKFMLQDLTIFDESTNSPS